MKKIILAFWMLSSIAASAAPALSGNSKAPIEINADSLEVLQNQKMAIFTGKVVAKQSNMTITADKMTVYYAEKSASGKGIKKIDVEGNVFLATPTETARGSTGNYDVINDFVTLSGNVVLTRQKNVLKGTKLEYDIKNGRSKLIGAQNSGRVQGLFVPEDKK